MAQCPLPQENFTHISVFFWLSKLFKTFSCSFVRFVPNPRGEEADERLPTSSGR